MPAPQALMMQQLARAKFMSFNLRVPANWKEPAGDHAAQFRNAFKPADRSTTPGSPLLFHPVSHIKIHTDIQKMHIANYGNIIDTMCSAICAAWAQWQSQATMGGIVINAITAAGGQLAGPPLFPLIMAGLPSASPMQSKWSTAIANVLSTSWTAFTATVKVPALPWYPTFAAFALPAAPPTPNIPCTFAQLVQVPTAISAQVMKAQMITQLADPKAPFQAELFESLCDAFEKCYATWKTTTMVTNVLGMGPVPSYTPATPLGPVVAGVGTMAPGGLI